MGTVGDNLDLYQSVVCVVMIIIIICMTTGNTKRLKLVMYDINIGIVGLGRFYQIRGDCNNIHIYIQTYKKFVCFRDPTSDNDFCKISNKK